MTRDLQDAVDRVFPGIRAELESLVRIPSVSAEGAGSPAMRAAAERVRALLADAGLRAELVEVPGAPPAVLGVADGPPDAPRVLLYAHYDVQPSGPIEAWTTDPWEPTERAGRLYGRGASDDKSGVATHLGVLRAYREASLPLPVGVTVIVEGEEELGSPHAAALLDACGDRLAADAIVIADSEHWAVGHPALTVSLRGLVDAVVEVRTLQSGVHSGQFGGAIPDALMTLSRLLATLHDDEGRPAVAGLLRAADPAVEVEEDEVRRTAGVREGVSLIGEGPLASRLWGQPAISVLAIDAPRISEAINQLVPVARAKVSVRIAPGEEPERAMDALVAHLEAHVPWGAEVTVTRGSAAPAFALGERGTAFSAFADGMEAAWGVKPAEIGIGGTIPLVSMLAERFPQAAVLLTGVGEPTSHIHGPDESQDLGELRRSILAEAIALQNLAKSRK